MDKPNDQSSRWSSESNYPPQVNSAHIFLRSCMCQPFICALLFQGSVGRFWKNKSGIPLYLIKLYGLLNVNMKLFKQYSNLQKSELIMQFCLQHVH